MTEDKLKFLTPREKEIALLIGDGLSSRDIAARLRISKRTIEIHRRNIGIKIGVYTPRENKIKDFINANT